MPLGVVHVEAVVRGDAAVAEREVSLGARSAQLTPEARKRYPARHSRKATLEMSAHRRGELLRPRSRGANYSSRIVINVSPPQLACLRHELGQRALPARPTARDVLLASARLGGHLRNNGDPGWLTLARDLHDLELLERGYLSARMG